MKKYTISKLFLYRYRFHIGYTFLALVFLFLVIVLPEITTRGLSEAEMESAVSSYNLHFSSITSGNLIDLPYHFLQKFMILSFGMTTFAIKFPSIMVAIALGFLIILLLNRWFKSNVALLASILTVLSIPFLHLAGTGTPDIMVVFWPTLLLWLGSKIQGEKKPQATFCFIFAFTLLFSIFTPHMIYLALFIVAYVMLNPHLRFTVKSLPKLPFSSFCLVIALGLVVLALNFISNPSIALQLFFAENLDLGQYFNNIKVAFIPFFSWNTTPDGIFLTPLIGLPTFFLAFTGLFSTVKGFFASRNSIASCLIVFTVLISGFNPNSALLLIIPVAILVAHGLKYILEKWYGLFPENPYARIFGVFPITTFIIIMIISGLSHFIFGYRYTPAVANNYNNDLQLVDKLEEGTNLVLAPETLNYKFYKVYEDRTHKINITPTNATDFPDNFATISKPNFDTKGKKLNKIITSQKSANSDRIYLYITENSNNEEK